MRQKVRAALLAVRDPVGGAGRGGRRHGARLLGQEPPLGRRAGLYLSAAPGYELSAGTRGEAVRPSGPWAPPRRPPARRAAGRLHDAGPAWPQGVDLGPIRQIDVAPTLCALLGIDPPAQATGAVLTKALARRVARHSEAALRAAPARADCRIGARCRQPSTADALRAPLSRGSGRRLGLARPT